MQDTYKRKILDAALEHVAFDGWNEGIFATAAKDLNTTEEHCRLHFEEGVLGLVQYYSEQNDAEMIEKIKAQITENMRIRDKIKMAVEIRLELYKSRRMIVSKTVNFLSLPQNLVKSSKMIWKTVDLMWRHAANDKSTDFNYYTKRTLLAGIYSAVIMYWLADESENYQETHAFLDRRIDDVMKIGKFLGKKKG